MEVRKVDAVLVCLPLEAVINPNESVEPSAVLSVSPNKAAAVVPLGVGLENWASSVLLSVSPNEVVDPVVLLDPLEVAVLLNSGCSINPMVGMVGVGSLNSVISHDSVSSPNLLGGSPVLESSDLVVSPDLVSSGDSLVLVPVVLSLDSSGSHDDVSLSDVDVSWLFSNNRGWSDWS